MHDNLILNPIIRVFKQLLSRQEEMMHFRLLGRYIFVVLIILTVWISFSISEAAKSTRENQAVGLAAWESIYSVLTSPRCINCHTATNYPQQGDDRHRHFANVIRGPEGSGVPGLNCMSCHQGVNADSTGVPGGPDWHLAPLSMRWQDIKDRVLSSAEGCRSVPDRRKNEK